MKQFTQNGKIGFMDYRGQVILEAQFDAVDTFYDPNSKRQDHYADEDYEWAVLKDGKWGLIDNRTGSWITPCTWEAVSCFQYGLAKVKWAGRWGFINRVGTVVTYCQWDELEPFTSEGTVARAKRDGKVNYIRPGGAVLFEDSSIFKDLQFDAVDTFYDPNLLDWDYGEVCRGGYAGAGWEYGVLKDGKWGLIHWRERRWVTPCQWEAVSYFKNGLARVKRDGKWGFIDTEGNLVVPCQWDEIEVPDYCRYWSYFQFRAKRDGKYGYLDRNGREILTCEWDAVGRYDTEWMTVKQDGMWYVRNAEGKLFTPGEKENLFVFHEGLALIQDDTAYGLIDREGREVISCEWDAVGRLPEDVNGLPWKKDDKISSWTSLREYPTKLVKVRKNGKWGIYDLNGKECYSCNLDKIWRFQDGMAKICEDGKWGLMDEQGHMITPCQWEYIDYFRGETAAVRQNKHWGTIDRKGNLVHPCTHYVGLWGK